MKTKSGDTSFVNQEIPIVDRDGVLLGIRNLDGSIMLEDTNGNWYNPVKTEYIIVPQQTTVKISKPYENQWEPKGTFTPFDYSKYKAEIQEKYSTKTETKDNPFLYGVNISLLVFATLCYILTTFKIKLL